MQVKVALLALSSACLIEYGAARLCNPKDISNKDVSGCECKDTKTGCSSTCTYCASDPIFETKGVKDCKSGCTESQTNCTGCGLYFHTVCDCIKHGGCENTAAGGVIMPGPAPIWIYDDHDPKDPLITTTEFLPGILQMRGSHERGWTYAQEHYKPQSQAVFLNSARARKMEHVHIHVCRSRNAQTAKNLADEHIQSSTSLIKTVKEPELYCLGVNHSVTITNFAGALSNWLAKLPVETPPICKDLVGAGILQDTHGRTWACASKHRKGPQDMFCQ
ncbi:hypothetical protein JDV02_007806 [Purpureocillium takamizusanense]|uniref:Uncharacterized protein n=1 Tax=Purpureocillium takamizusanense TaxID=2060973 RepID=A0A9Q8QLK3_9HYPO|nr:uncharacterized protein JDV02_007806 [Purpureocillium takamizusanense]UNI21855.1 hypothetical protein JDV02_007806 [Purpureocillium takamizusanense]